MGSSNAENPQQLPELEPLPPKDSDPALLPEPDCAPPKGLEQKKRKRGKKRNNNSEVNGEEAKSNSSNVENPQLFPKLDPLPPKDSNLPMLPEPEPATPKEPEHKKRRGKKRKNNIVVDGEEAESNRSNAENPQLFPELDPLPPKDSDLPLLPELEPATPKEPEQKKRRSGEKRINNSVVDGEGAESNRPNAENPELFPKLDMLPPKDPNLRLLPHPEPGLPKELEQKKRRDEKRINNSVVDDEGAESNRPNAENPQLFPKLDPLPLEDSNLRLLPEPELALPKEPEQKKRKGGKKRKNNSVVNGEGAESNRPDAENPQLFPKLDPLPPKDSNIRLLPEPEPALPKELEQKKRRDEKRINNSVVDGEGAESNRPNAENSQLFPKLDPLPLEDSNLRLLPEPEPAFPKEPEQKKRKRGKKRKNNSVVDGEEAESNRPNAEKPQLFPKLDPLPPKDSNLRLLPEPEPALPKELEQKKRREEKRINNSVVNDEGAESNRPNAENPQLFPKLDPLPADDSNLRLLPEPEPALPKELEQKKRKWRKKRKNNSVVDGEGAEPNRPNAENHQLFPELDPLPPEDSDLSLHPEPEPAPPKEPEQKKRRGKKRKSNSVVDGEGAKSNRSNADNPKLFPEFDPLPPKDSNLPLLSEPESTPPKELDQPKEKKGAVNGEGQLNRPNEEKAQLFSELGPLPPKDSDPSLLLKPEPALAKDPAQPMKKTEEEKRIEAQPNKKTEEKKIEAQPKKKTEEEMKIEAQPKKKTEEEKKIGAQPKKSEEGTKIEAQQKKRSEEEKIEREKFVRRKYMSRSVNQLGGISRIIPHSSSVNQLGDISRIIPHSSSVNQLGGISRIVPHSSYLGNNQVICYFCLDIGHSLGECPQSPGVKFPNCLVCNERGHISTKCPQRSHDN